MYNSIIQSLKLMLWLQISSDFDYVILLLKTDFISFLSIINIVKDTIILNRLRSVNIRTYFIQQINKIQSSI